MLEFQIKLHNIRHSNNLKKLSDVKSPTQINKAERGKEEALKAYALYVEELMTMPTQIAL